MKTKVVKQFQQGANMYTAVVLDQASREKLIDRLEFLPDFCGDYRYVPCGSSRLPHHLTLNMGGITNGLNDASVLGKAATLTVDAFCWDDSLGVCAARVTSMQSQHGEALKTTNKQAHITMCLLSHGKPVKSNDLDWSKAVSLDEPLTATGVVQEC
jgi:hypothetical protein